MSSSSSSRDKVRASHILIKHEGSRRKASWKDPEGRVISNTTRESAVSQLKSLREDIVSGKAKFEDVAARYSDCSSAKRGGNLGKILFWLLLILFVLLLCMYIFVLECANLVFYVLIVWFLYNRHWFHNV